MWFAHAGQTNNFFPLKHHQHYIITFSFPHHHSNTSRNGGTYDSLPCLITNNAGAWLLSHPMMSHGGEEKFQAARQESVHRASSLCSWWKGGPYVGLPLKQSCHFPIIASTSLMKADIKDQDGVICHQRWWLLSYLLSWEYLEQKAGQQLAQYFLWAPGSAPGGSFHLLDSLAWRRV